MKYTHLLALGFSVLFLTACSSSTSSVADAPAANTKPAESVAAAEAEEGDGYRCERVAVTGTRMTQKYCTTRKQREEIARSAAAGVNRMTLKNTQAGGPAGN